MRLIDADAMIPKGTKVAEEVIAVHNAVQSAPTVEAEPVVYCYNCKYSLLNLKWKTILCMRTAYRESVKPNDFCSRGEKFVRGDTHV